MWDLYEKLINSLTQDLDGFIFSGYHFKYTANIFDSDAWVSVLLDEK